MANSRHKTTVVLSALDKMSRVINAAFKNAEGKLANFQKKADRVSRKAAEVGRTSAAIGTAVAAPLVLAGKAAIDFEEAMADVSKVLGLKQGSQELNAMGNESQRLAIHLAKTPRSAAEMIAALAQGGTARDELFKIGKFTGEMSVAFDVMADRAGSAFTKTKNALGATTEATFDVMNAINHLSDNSAAKASQILDFMASGGAASARAMKITGQESASLGAFFISMGKSGSEAATIVSRLTKGLNKNNKAGKIFRASGGGLKGLFEVMKAGDKLKGVERAAFFQQFGQYGMDIGLAASNMEQLHKVTGLVSDQTKFAGSVAAEFANRSNTRAFELARLQSQLQATGIKIGNALLPVVSELATALTPILEKMALWIEKNPKLTGQIVKGMAVFAGAMFVVSGLSFAMSGAAKAASFLTGGFRLVMGVGRGLMLILTRPAAMLRLFRLRALKLVKAIRFIGMAVSWVGRLLIANPIGAVITAIAVAAFLIYKYWEPIKAFFTRLWTVVKATFANGWEFISGIGSRFFEAGKNIMKSLWSGMKSLAMKPVEAIKRVVEKMRAYLPFSPAKVGPFRDLHRVKIVETIAQSIRPAPALAAMKRTVSAMVNVSPNGSPMAMSSAGGGSGITINFQPSVNLGMGGDGSGTVKDQILEGLRSYSGELIQMIDDARRRQDRTKY